MCTIIIISQQPHNPTPPTNVRPNPVEHSNDRNVPINDSLEPWGGRDNTGGGQIRRTQEQAEVVEETRYAHAVVCCNCYMDMYGTIL